MQEAWEVDLSGPVQDASSIFPRALQGEHAGRPPLLFTVRGHPQVLGSKDAPPAVAAGGVGVHGGCGCWHQLIRHWSTCAAISTASIPSCTLLLDGTLFFSDPSAFLGVRLGLNLAELQQCVVQESCSGHQ